MEKLDDISVLNERAFSVLTENELQVRFKDIYRRINDEHEYDESGHIAFLPLSRLNSRLERQECRDIISSVIESGCFTSGPYNAKVEETLSTYYGAHACIATSSGTDALIIALKSLGVSRGDEVIVPLNSFAATENAVMAVGAIPVFANIDASFNMLADEVVRLRTSRTKAVLPVCLYGSCRYIDVIYRIAREANIQVIVDAAQCFGIWSLMNYCDLLTLSFNPFKNIGSYGKSGAVLTQSPEHARMARQYSYHGFAQDKKNIKAQDWGLNSRMDNMQAATLSVKLRHFENNAKKRCLLAARYYLLLEVLSHKITLPPEKYQNTWHLFPVLIRQGERDSLFAFAREKGVELDIYYPVLSHCGEHPLATGYSCPEQFNSSEIIHSALFHLPLHNHMSLQEQNSIVGVLHDYFK
ncbi:DegT/DnrJ/EryC1/StrS family aminotransferase [Erwinia amylovora]|uniref:UDP-4-amino-4-deoxy-L-arabinose--oxoglutarateamin otransferase n=3 Tax=Erwinia amylovora TaxID=552 RepID=A0A831A1D6_ERWAM|nr:DegT/DnrJ/EryC1/StrS family aminotransferase [Erwinia amylovora]CDK14224.1 UDP-4-amino-4-deoxy-L-arabinose-oxoglutarateaminotransferase [Erwinia amylovora LA635]CDK17591.1 UDP-4-amino-4-deoxy-L-arabinose-oxoglutarateaminotransferase [Erwinia amylovora LA636]CDK20960.1 UDP-4-amino-4-deoxy-L-arabinose-oxoglutarateaminotransferase [Erwinia amylovora LA637]ATZ12563.1 UDP-4-amino-4-deoxy-L-arabinose-oxoglutarate aminotransferase [Erwinia amylovora]EKV55483.1 UDP-4-amino-4-deoxy-L-arabinose-oxogl